MRMTEKPFLNLIEAANLLGVSRSTMYKYAAQPNFPVVKRGKLFFPRDKLIEYWGKK